MAPSARVELSDGGYGSLNVESSLDTVCSKKTTLWGSQQLNHLDSPAENSPITSASLCRFAVTSSVGECGLFAGPLSIESSRPLGSSLGLLAALGFTSLPSTAVMAVGEGGFALTEGSAGDETENKLGCFSKVVKIIIPISRMADLSQRQGQTCLDPERLVLHWMLENLQQKAFSAGWRCNEKQTQALGWRHTSYFDNAFLANPLQRFLKAILNLFLYHFFTFA